MNPVSDSGMKQDLSYQEAIGVNRANKPCIRRWCARHRMSVVQPFDFSRCEGRNPM